VKKPKAQPPPDEPTPAEVMARLEAGKAVTLEQAAKAARALGRRLVLDIDTRHGGRTVKGWIVSPAAKSPR